ncbi:MAG: group II intron maturase-specific domain-containing protein, partial [Saprospiraceae bacterium]|nr:group II intron maturase-specific domain-containing protein [Saprospiraceae bacterium]
MKSRNRIIQDWKEMKFYRDTSQNIQAIAEKLNVQTRGIIQYYGKYNIDKVGKLFRHLDFRLAKWVKNKYKSTKNSYLKANDWLRDVKSSFPTLFYHGNCFERTRFVRQGPYEGRLCSTVLGKLGLYDALAYL